MASFLGNECCCGGCTGMQSAVARCGLARVTKRTVDGVAKPDYQVPMAWGGYVDTIKEWKIPDPLWFPGPYGICAFAASPTIAIDGVFCAFTQDGLLFTNPTDYSGCGLGYLEAFTVACCAPFGQLCGRGGSQNVTGFLRNDFYVVPFGTPLLVISIGPPPNTSMPITKYYTTPLTPMGDGTVGADVTYTVTENLLSGPVDHVVKYHVEFLATACPADDDCFAVGLPAVNYTFDWTGGGPLGGANAVAVDLTLTCGGVTSDIGSLLLYWNADVKMWVLPSTTGKVVATDNVNGEFFSTVYTATLTCAGVLTVDIQDGTDPGLATICSFQVTLPAGGLPTTVPVSCGGGSCSGGSVTVFTPAGPPAYCFENLTLRFTNPAGTITQVGSVSDPIVLSQVGTSSIYTGLGYYLLYPPLWSDYLLCQVQISVDVSDYSVFAVFLFPQGPGNPIATFSFLNTLPVSTVLQPLLATYPGNSFFITGGSALDGYFFTVDPGSVLNFCNPPGLPQP